MRSSLQNIKPFDEKQLDVLSTHQPFKLISHTTKQHIPLLLCHHYVRERQYIQIPSPCQQPWSELTLVGKGRFYATLIILSFLLSVNANAQCIRQPEIYVTIPVGYIAPEKPVKAQRLISGTVKDNAGRVVPFVSIVIKGTLVGVMCDINGDFAIRTDASNPVLTASHTSYPDIEQVVPDSVAHVNFVFQNDFRLSDEVIITTRNCFGGARRVKKAVVVKETNIIQNTVSVFPNPVARRETINLRWSQAVKNHQNVEIFNIAGTLVQRNIIEVKKSITEARIQLNIANAGNYVLRITDMKSNKLHTEQIIVQ